MAIDRDLDLQTSRPAEVHVQSPAAWREKRERASAEPHTRGFLKGYRPHLRPPVFASGRGGGLGVPLPAATRAG